MALEFLPQEPALGPLENQRSSFFWVKLAGSIFFIGVFAFALAFAKLHQAMFAQDEVAHATRRKDVAAIRSNSNLSSSSMMAANKFAYVGAVAFFVGCIIGLIAFLSY